MIRNWLRPAGPKYIDCSLIKLAEVADIITWKENILNQLKLDCWFQHDQIDLLAGFGEVMGDQMDVQLNHYKPDKTSRPF